MFMGTPHQDVYLWLVSESLQKQVEQQYEPISGDFITKLGYEPIADADHDNMEHCPDLRSSIRITRFHIVKRRRLRIP